MIISVKNSDGEIVELGDLLGADYQESGSVSWAQNSSAVNLFDITPPTSPAANQVYLVSIKNTSTVDLAVGVYNRIDFEGTVEDCELVESGDFVVPASTSVSKVVQGMLAGVTSRLLLSLASSAPADTTAYIDVRRC